MSARWQHMATRLWPDSLFRRLGIILFAGLLVAHVLSFGLVALNAFGPSAEAADDYFMRYIATAVAILDRVRPEERPAWLDRLARPAYRYVAGDQGEIEAAPPKRRQENLARLKDMLGPGHDAVSVFYLDSLQQRQLGWFVRLKDGSPILLEFVAQRTVISPWLPTAFALQLVALAILTWIAVKLATRPLARLERAANSLGPELRGELLPEDGPNEVARAATAFNAMQRRIAEQASERIRFWRGYRADFRIQSRACDCAPTSWATVTPRQSCRATFRKCRRSSSRGLPWHADAINSASSAARPICTP